MSNDPFAPFPAKASAPLPRDPALRFARFVVSGYGGSSSCGSECWVWTGSACPRGYGRFSVSRSKSPAMAHRFSWELRNGKIPDGLELDHLCRNTSCVNPDHLEPVTSMENRARNSSNAAPLLRGPICYRGHDTRVTGINEWGGMRRCRACALEYGRAHNRARRERIKATKEAV